MTQPDSGSSLLATKAAFIRDFAQWRWWCTLTFRGRVTFDDAEQALGYWLHRIAEVMQTHVRVSWASGPQSSGNPHFHVLLSWSCDSVIFSDALATLLWRQAHRSAGNVKTDEYDPEKAAAFYHAQHDNWDVGIECPRFGRCRRRKCKQSGYLKV